jgi:hypothetical protein
MTKQDRIESVDTALAKAAVLYPKNLEGNKSILIDSIRKILSCMPEYSTSIYLGSGYQLKESDSDFVRENSRVTSISEDMINFDDYTDSYNIYIGDLGPRQLYELLQYVADFVKSQL